MGRSPFPGSSAPLQPQPTPMPVVPPRPTPMGQARQPTERRTLVVGRGISVQGVVQDAERLVVEGTVESTMIHAAELAVAQGGVFRGEIEVEDAARGDGQFSGMDHGGFDSAFDHQPLGILHHALHADATANDQGAAFGGLAARVGRCGPGRHCRRNRRLLLRRRGGRGRGSAWERRTTHCEGLLWKGWAERRHA